MKKRFSEEQIIGFLREAEAGLPIKELCSSRCANTMRTARSRTSGEYLLVFFMAPSSQELEPPRYPGRFNVTCPTGSLNRF